MFTQEETLALLAELRTTSDPQLQSAVTKLQRLLTVHDQASIPSANSDAVSLDEAQDYELRGTSLVLAGRDARVDEHTHATLTAIATALTSALSTLLSVPRTLLSRAVVSAALMAALKAAYHVDRAER